MLRTFNCGIGFCVITKKENIEKIIKNFKKPYIPYQIGYISKNKKKVNLFNEIKW